MKFTNKNIFISNEKTKKAVISSIAKYAKKIGVITSYEKLEHAFLEREKISSTGFGNGVAIPHARIPQIKEATILIARLKEPVNWESIDGKKISIALAILVPDDKNAPENHMKFLSTISQELLDENFQQLLKKGTNTSIVNKVKNMFSKTSTKITQKEGQKLKQNTTKVVAVTACATGIAHTYMAAKKLEKEAIDHNIDIKVQKNGASGPEDILTSQDIKDADYVIIASDVVVDLEKFNGKKMIKIPVAYSMKNTKKIFETLEKEAFVYKNNVENKNAKTASSKKNSSWMYRNILTHIMNGVSHIIPLLVSAGVLLAVGKLLASFTGDVKIADNYKELSLVHGTANVWFKFVYFINISGIVTLWLMFPVFGMFTAQSIGGKSAIIPGFFVGILADGDHLFSRIWRTFNINDISVNPFPKDTYPFIQGSAGFFGVLIGAILIGYFVAFLNKTIKIHGIIAPLKSILIVPGIAILVTVTVQTFVINPPFALLNEGIKDLAEKSTSFVIGFGLFVAVATAFDLGGPINKSVGAVAIGLAATGTMPLTARTISIVIPPIGLGIATILAKPIFKRELYDHNLKIAGRTSIFLGLIAITEGGLPFLFEKPLTTIIACVLGAVAGTLFTLLIGVQMWQPLPAIYGWGLVGIAPANAAVTTKLVIWAQILFYIVGIAIGSLTTAFTDMSLRFFQSKKVNNSLLKE